jgi:hypothetical protein
MKIFPNTIVAVFAGNILMIRLLYQDVDISYRSESTLYGVAGKDAFV